MLAPIVSALHNYLIQRLLNRSEALCDIEFVSIGDRSNRLGVVQQKKLAIVLNVWAWIPIVAVVLATTVVPLVLLLTFLSFCLLDETA